MGMDILTMVSLEEIAVFMMIISSSSMMTIGFVVDFRNLPAVVFIMGILMTKVK
jgi:hypothetical protein